MRRSRQKNTLLPKMMGIAVVIVAIVLPIVARIGEFKAEHQKYMEAKLIELPKVKQPPPPPKKHAARPKPHIQARRSRTKMALAASQKPNPNQPKVVASTGTGNGNGPVIANNGTGQVGQVPVAPAAPPAPAPAPPAPAPAPTPPPPTPKPAPTPAPTPAPAPAPAPPVIVEAEPIDQPQPVIPDDLEGIELPSTFKALFSIRADGSTTVSMVQSTGNATLDGLALNAAKRWKFRPATKDGQPVDSYRRLEVDFVEASS